MIFWVVCQFLFTLVLVLVKSRWVLIDKKGKKNYNYNRGGLV